MVAIATGFPHVNSQHTRQVSSHFHYPLAIVISGLSHVKNWYTVRGVKLLIYAESTVGGGGGVSS